MLPNEHEINSEEGCRAQFQVYVCLLSWPHLHGDVMIQEQCKGSNFKALGSITATLLEAGSSQRGSVIRVTGTAHK
jgi:hypothetical protein